MVGVITFGAKTHSARHTIRRRFNAVLHISGQVNGSTTINGRTNKRRYSWASLQLGDVTTERHYRWAPLQLGVATTGAVTTGCHYNWVPLPLGPLFTRKIYLGSKIFDQKFFDPQNFLRPEIFLT